MLVRRRLFRRLLALFRKNKMEDDIADELQFHLDSEIEKNIAAGMIPEGTRWTTTAVPCDLLTPENYHPRRW